MMHVGRGAKTNFPGGWRAAGFILLGGLAVSAARAQVAMPPALPSAPLAPPPPDLAASVTADETAREGADALQMGLPDLAERLLTRALASPDLPAARRDKLNLDLASARLALAKDAAAKAALDAVTAPDSTAYVLRAGLLEARAGLWTEAAGHLARVQPDQLTAAERPWYYFTQGLLEDHAGHAAQANKFREQARDAATTPLQKAQFDAALYRGVIIAGDATPQLEQTLRQSAATNPGQPGILFAKQLAIVLELLYQRGAAPDGHAQAVAVVQDLLRTVRPDSQDPQDDDIRLLLGLLDKNSGRSATELEKILKHQGDRHTMEIALALLQNNAFFGGNPAEMQQFYDDQIKQVPKHPLLDQLYLLRAQLALDQNQSEVADKYAQQLLQEFPGSPARQAALGLRAYIAWRSEPRLGGRAADYVNQLRAELPEGPDRVRLTALLADMYYLNGDYRNAADFYAALLLEPAPPQPRGALLFRAVESQLQAGRLEEAIKNLEAAAALNDVAPLDRWRAEWNVIRALRADGRDADAFARLDRLAGPSATALPTELRLRLRWLAARLAVDARDPSAVTRARALQEDLDLAARSPGDMAALPPDLWAQLQSNALLLRGQAAFLVGDMNEYHRAFDLLRAGEYKDSDASAYSMFDEARQLATDGNFAGAQTMMKELAQKFPLSDYAPEAYYEAALNAKARGQYQDALAQLGPLLRYTDKPLVYQGRLLYGELQRQLNNVPEALAAYNSLLRDWPTDHPLRARAAMGKADCLVVLAVQDPANRAAAVGELESLVSSKNLPVDARVEAGFKLGNLLESGDATDRDHAAEAYFNVIQSFLQNPATAAQLGAQGTGRYWMVRCLFALAELYEEKNQLDQAQKLYHLVIDRGFTEGQSTAESRLKKQPNASAPAPPPAAPAPAPVPAGA